ncbi:hypothetical protein BJ508DRAFT_338838 [Ascobolus immersus RN42]|uniref:Uncharacterized protein n=1 Tax=Ascobolus immersus RN42 TaxID=1160509 RepID=A0A3N4IJK5_ASCIM|nr:hypothetical protein BJ508DRAFT_338838 [Ascobolus immersus RN42]
MVQLSDEQLVSFLNQIKELGAVEEDARTKTQQVEQPPSSDAGAQEATRKRYLVAIDANICLLLAIHHMLQATFPWRGGLNRNVNANALLDYSVDLCLFHMTFCERLVLPLYSLLSKEEQSVQDSLEEAWMNFFHICAAFVQTRLDHNPSQFHHVEPNITDWADRAVELLEYRYLSDPPSEEHHAFWRKRLTYPETAMDNPSLVMKRMYNSIKEREESATEELKKGLVELSADQIFALHNCLDILPKKPKASAFENETARMSRLLHDIAKFDLTIKGVWECEYLSLHSEVDWKTVYRKITRPHAIQAITAIEDLINGPKLMDLELKLLQNNRWDVGHGKYPEERFDRFKKYQSFLVLKAQLLRFLYEGYYARIPKYLEHELTASIVREDEAGKRTYPGNYDSVLQEKGFHLLAGPLIDIYMQKDSASIGQGRNIRALFDSFFHIAFGHALHFANSSQHIAAQGSKPDKAEKVKANWTKQLDLFLEKRKEFYSTPERRDVGERPWKSSLKPDLIFGTVWDYGKARDEVLSGKWDLMKREDIAATEIKKGCGSSKFEGCHAIALIASVYEIIHPKEPEPTADAAGDSPAKPYRELFEGRATQLIFPSE